MADALQTTHLKVQNLRTILNDFDMIAIFYKLKYQRIEKTEPIFGMDISARKGRELVLQNKMGKSLINED